MIVATFGMALFLIARPLPAVSAETPEAVKPPHPVYTQGPNARPDAAAAFVARIRETGSLPVIVGLRLKLQPEDGLSPTAQRVQSLALDTAQSRVVTRVLGQNPPEVKRYSFIPFMALRVTEAQFQKLLNDPDVASIEEDISFAPLLSDTIPLVHASDVLKKYGVSGNGQMIAILDSGVAKSHPMLAGKVVSEACYSTNDPAQQRTSVCPGGVTATTARGSGVNCPVNITGCSHGTHVASIAAGTAVGILRGVASSAGIIAIQVFSKVAKPDLCGGPNKTPCVLSAVSDIVKGLERVFALRRTFKIAAVNLSLGSHAYSIVCDSDFPAYTQILGKLRQAGIAPVAAAGNRSSDTDIGSPACISTAIAVSSTSKGDDVKQVEYVSKTSDLNSLVGFTAPGEKVLAAVPKGSACIHGGSPFCEFSGTSMAAPHVAGAIAVLRQAVPRAGVDSILNALECSGKMVELTGDIASPRRLARPRIDLLGAYNYLKNIPKRSWNFNTKAQAFDWSPFTQEWLVSDGQYHAGFAVDDNIFSSTAHCGSAVDVTADMTRKHPKFVAFESAPASGLILKTQLNYVTRQYSGYFFAYVYYWGVPAGTRGRAFILRLDNTVVTTLCVVNTDVPVKDDQQNKIRAVSDDVSHKLHINGKLVCSAPNDGIYQSGAVTLFTDHDANVPSLGGSFDVDAVTIVSKDTAVARAAVGSRTSTRQAASCAPLAGNDAFSQWPALDEVLPSVSPPK